MGKHKSCNCRIKRCDKKIFKARTRVLGECNFLMRSLNSALDGVFRETEINPISAYSEFKRVMNRFINRAAKINARVLGSMDLIKTLRSSRLLTRFLSETGTTSRPSTISAAAALRDITASPVLTNIAVTPAPLPNASSVTPGQIAAIRNILQRAIREVRTLLGLAFRLATELLGGRTPSPETEAIQAVLFFVFIAIAAKIAEIEAAAAVDIITVLTGI